jgi:predicted nucleic acid-binding protein
VAVPAQPVAADACFLINFLAVDRMDLLGSLVSYRFHCPFEVSREVVRPVQAERLERAIAAGILALVEIVDLAEIALLTDLLHEQLGRGESACLALAESRGWVLASDERGRFRRLATERIGDGRLMTTRDALEQAVAVGSLEGPEARALAEDLRDNHRFMMAIPDIW